MIVYLAVNRVNQKAYVGKTTKSLRHRFVVHEQKARLGYKSHFYSAIRKYGIESFDVAVLEECFGIDELNIAEIRWIATMGSLAPFGYNTTIGGEGCSGAPKTEVWKSAVTDSNYRKRQSEMMRQVRAAKTPEEKERWRVSALSAAARAPRVALRGDDNPSKRPDVREKIRLSKVGKPRSPELRARLSKIARDRWQFDPDYRQRSMASRPSQKGILKPRKVSQ